MYFFKVLAVFVICFMFSVFVGCKAQESSMAVGQSVDYSKNANWSIKCDKPEKEIDVFFVHPTTYGPPSNGKYNADLSDTKLNDKTDRDVVCWITEAFSDNCNVFAPRYRQVNIEVMSMSPEEKEGYFKIPVGDIKNAFEYYLNNLNNGRPFIIASHSQGSNVMQMVLIENPGLVNKDKLVAAYMVGWTFTDKDLQKIGLKLSEYPDQIGGVITWNTIGPGGKSPTISKGARCVNPLSWTTDTKEYPASEHKGAKILQADGKKLLVNNFTSARINKAGALEIPTPKPAIAIKLNMSMGKECYHRYDYDFFFNNVKANVAVRCKAYLDKQNVK